MQYGHFSDDGKEFIIDNVETPTPWINYLQNGQYFALISNNGGGYSYIKSPLHGRITRYRLNDVPPDRPGKYIYIKDLDSGEVWSLTWQPVGKFREAYRVIHGFGYTRAESHVSGIDGSVNYFVPLNDTLEIWDVKLKNTSNRRRRLAVIGYVEFALGHALIDIINQCDDQHFNRIYFDRQLNSLFATKTYWVTKNTSTQHQENNEWDQWAFFTLNQPIKKYETVREQFLGFYRNENNPLAIERDSFSCRDRDFGNVVGAIWSEIELESGQEKRFHFKLGVIPKDRFDRKKKVVIEKYHSDRAVDQALNEVKDYWERFFSSVRVKTPDKELNIFLNYWTPYQAKMAFDVGRVASFYYWGIARGYGFRDTAQDTIAVTIAHPEKARERIKLLARQMFRNGSVYHHFYGDGQGETTGHCDDPLWFILAVSDYIKETGDLEILKHKERFLDTKEEYPILQHLLAVVNFVENNLGKHGLPIFGRGDWNDTLDYIGGDEGGESVWGAMFYATLLKDLIELLEFIGKNNELKRVKAVQKSLTENIERYCWDGEWYIRAFGQDERKIGSGESEAGQIFLNTQSWAVLAGLPDKDRLIKAMDSVKIKLDTPYGPKICAPAYRKIDPDIGLVTRCVPGKKENAAVFCHPTTWLIQAECLLGRGNHAYEYYKKLLPSNLNSSRFKTEPYVYAQYITSDEHSTAGQASHSWQTGTAAWMFRVTLDYLIGVRATLKGLLIDPVIPSFWKEFSIERVFRGSTYKIHIKNPDGLQKGVKSIKINGKPISGNILPLFKNEEIDVEVLMGG
ncbi:MAG: glycosyl transferase family 36 [Calditrichaeota bacterium]|nr:glycosyl transferase family 36 [Calditrichota bacterium]